MERRSELLLVSRESVGDVLLELSPGGGFRTAPRCRAAPCLSLLGLVQLQGHSMIEPLWSHWGYDMCVKLFATSFVKPGSGASYIALSTAPMTCFGPSQADCKPSCSTSHVSCML
jgi:hypothetical protein